VDGVSGWRDSAACLGEDPELFFPIGNTGPAVLQIEEAKAVCRRCDVVETCLRWALDTQQDAGVWAGPEAADEPRAPRWGAGAVAGRGHGRHEGEGRAAAACGWRDTG